MTALHDPNSSKPRRKKKFNIHNAVVTFLLAVATAALMVQVPVHRQPSLLGWSFFGGEKENCDSEENEHIIPTILSVVDDKSGEYVFALNNSLYGQLKEATVEHLAPKIHTAYLPELHLDKKTIGIRESLRISWTKGMDGSGKPIVKDDDVIVLFCAGSETFLDAATIAQARATSKKHGDDPGNDSHWYFSEFPILRHDKCHFELYRARSNDPGSTIIFISIATSETLHIDNGNTAPTAVHLALTNNIEEMLVQFKTGVQGIPVVKYGLVEDSLLLTVTGSSHTYYARDMCQEPAIKSEPGKFQPPGMLHMVMLKHLEPNTTYYYRVGVLQEGSLAEPTWSNTYSFVSAPEVQANSEPFSYIVYGDQGCPSVGWGDGGKWTAAMTAREVNSSIPIRAVHHFGDLSYARGAAHIWDDWLHMISSFTVSIPLMVSVGNHEYDHTDGGQNGKDPSGATEPGGYRPIWSNYGRDSGGECGVPTVNHFHMPLCDKCNGVFWYSFDYGSVHTVVISSEHDLTEGSQQHVWLLQDLKAVERSVTPWVILELHRPLYESEIDPRDTLMGIELRKRIEYLLHDYQVDLVLAGHYHSYLRSCQGLYEGKCNNGGPVHITVGAAGARLRHGILYPNKWTDKFIKGTYGYGRITIANATALHFEFVQAGDVEDPDAGNVLDEAWILKETSSSLVPATVRTRRR